MKGKQPLLSNKREQTYFKNRLAELPLKQLCKPSNQPMGEQGQNEVLVQRKKFSQEKSRFFSSQDEKSTKMHRVVDNPIRILD